MGIPFSDNLNVSYCMYILSDNVYRIQYNSTRSIWKRYKGTIFDYPKYSAQSTLK